MTAFSTIFFSRSCILFLTAENFSSSPEREAPEARIFNASEYFPFFERASTASRISFSLPSATAFSKPDFISAFI